MRIFSLVENQNLQLRANLHSLPVSPGTFLANQISHKSFFLGLMMTRLQGQVQTLSTSWEVTPAEIICENLAPHDNQIVTGIGPSQTMPGLAQESCHFESLIFLVITSLFSMSALGPGRGGTETLSLNCATFQKCFKDHRDRNKILLSVHR